MEFLEITFVITSAITAPVKATAPLPTPGYLTVKMSGTAVSLAWKLVLHVQ